MQLNEAVLQRAIARYCSEHQEELISGVLTEQQVLDHVTEALVTEGIITGIKGLFSPGSTVQHAAGQLMNKASDAFQSAKTSVQNGVQKLQSDYQVGSAGGELRSLAQQRTKAEEQFSLKMDRFKESVALVQQQRYALRKEHRTLLRNFHQQAHAQYLRAAEGLGIPVSKGNAFYDAVDQALESRQMVPTVLTESWGQLDEGQPLVEEVPTAPVPVFEETPVSPNPAGPGTSPEAPAPEAAAPEESLAADGTPDISGELSPETLAQLQEGLPNAFAKYEKA